MGKHRRRNWKRTLPADRVVKLCGADVELGNVIQGPGEAEAFGAGAEASRALLAEIAGLPVGGRTIPWGMPDLPHPFPDHRDMARRFLVENGGCAYIDLNHAEICVPETLSAFDFFACWRAMLAIVQRAQRSANARIGPRRRLRVFANNSDGRGASWGSHLNLMMTRRAWDRLFRRRLHYLTWLASFQASSILYAGQGKVGSENGASEAAFQLSQRADFIETLMGEQTTHCRPLVNARNEPLCGDRSGEPRSNLARLHVISYDSTLGPSMLLAVGTLQLVTALIEAERVDVSLVLEDPVGAMRRWSRDPELQTRARTVRGRLRTAVELQSGFLDEALAFHAVGGFEGVVARAGEILALWQDTIEKLRARDMEALSHRIDWVLKKRILEEAMRRHDGIDWRSGEVKMLDHLFASLDPEEGLFWAYEAAGWMEQVVPAEAVERFQTTPPTDTRAWGRAMLLRRAGPERVEDVDWDAICFQVEDGEGRLARRTLRMSDPLDFTQGRVGEVLASTSTLEGALDALGAAPAEHDRFLPWDAQGPWSKSLWRRSP